MNEHYYTHVLNFAHRGASAAAPENTLAAFELAVYLGADGIELDLQLSRDGEVAICHDFNVDKTTNASGRVSDFTLSDLKQMDAGSWFSEEFSGETIPTLDETIERVGSRLLFNVELKTGAIRANGLEEKVGDIIQRRDFHSRVIVSSFNPFALLRMHRVDPRIDLGLLHAPDLPFYLRNPWLRHLIPFQAMHPEGKMADEAYMRWARKRGYRVNVWTVDSPADIRRLIALDVNTVISNRPDLVREIIDQGISP